MQGVRTYIHIIFCLTSLLSYGQRSFTSVDSTSFAMYNSQQWEQLTVFGEQAINEGYDYYYLNLRTGIAYFNLKEYNKSLLYIYKSLENNSLSQIAKEYLFWNHYYLNNEEEMIDAYTELDDSIQNRIGYTPPKKLQFVYVESGVKVSDKQNLAGNILYGNIGLMHHANSKLDIYYSYTYSQQKLNWGSFLQNEFYIRPSYTFKKGWSAILGLHYAGYNANTDYTTSRDYYNSYSKNNYTSDYYTTINSNLNGELNLTNYFGQITVQKQWKHFSLSPNLSILSTAINPKYQKTETENYTIKEYFNSVFYTERDSTSTRTTTYSDSSFIAVNGGFSMRYYTPRFSIGIELSSTTQSIKNKFIVIPSISWSITDKINISGYYFNKKDATFGIENGMMLFNNSNENQKISITTKYTLTKKTSIYATYQYDKLVDNLYIQTYNMNTFFIGLIIKL